MRRQINAEELNTLYVLIGQGIWQLQNVEDVLNTTISIKRDVKVRGAVTFEQGEAILLKHRKNTLGTSLKIARESEIFNIVLQKRLDTFKKERDWLVHNCVLEHREDLYLDEKRAALLYLIQKFSEEASDLQKLVAQDLEDFVVAQGVSRDWIFQEAVNKIEKLKGNKI